MASENSQEVINRVSTSQPSTPTAAKVSVAALQVPSVSLGRGEPYVAKTALKDVPVVRLALQLFLESKMVESEALMNAKDPVK